MAVFAALAQPDGFGHISGMGLRFQGGGAAKAIRWAAACAALLGTSAFAQTEAFEGALFPPAGWTNGGTAIWFNYAVSAYGVGTNSAMAAFYSVSAGTGMLETALFEAPAAGATLGFDYAYAAFGADYVDRLAIQVSTNAGATYSLLLDMPGGTNAALNTAGTQSSYFVPTAAEWKTKSIPLPTGANRIRFDAITDYGNNLFLDNVQIYDGTSAADLALSLADSPDPVLGGSNLTYAIAVSNAGPATAEGVVLTNGWPAGAILVSAEASRGSWITNGETIVADLGSLAVGEAATATLVVQPLSAGIATNVAEVSAATWDPQTGNNRATETTAVDPADLALTVVDSPDPVAVGSNLTYAIAVSNAGPATAEGVVLTNRWPAGALLVSAEASRGNWITNGETIVADLGSLAVGEMATATLVVQPQSEGTITNWAEVSTSSFDLQSGNNRQSAATLVSHAGGNVYVRTNFYGVSEDRGTLALYLYRTNGVIGEISIDYETVDGTATAGSDYTDRRGTLVLSNNVTSASLSIPILNDADPEDDESFTVRLYNPQGGAVLSAPSNATILIHDEDGLAALPFEEGFESGALSNYWGFYSTATTGPKIDTNDLPHGGIRHLNMNGVPTYSLNELVLNADLSGREGVHLRFWHKRLPYETDSAMSETFQGHSYADGVAISVDGTNWCKVHGLTLAETGTNEYRQFDVALDPILAAYGLGYTSRVRIKFQAYGYYYPPYYGRFFDDVELYTSAGNLRFAAEEWMGTEAGGAVTVTVERVVGDSGEVGVDYETFDGSALAGSDYAAATGTLTFSNGVRQQAFVVSILDDGDDEPQEAFGIRLFNPQGGAELASPTQAVVRIDDDDGPGEVAFAAAQYAEQEDNGFAAIAVNRLYGRDGEVSVRWRTQAGTATPGADYVESTGTVVFADGEVQSLFEIPLLDDATVEGPETVQLFLEEPGGGATLGTPTNACLTIQDDEAPRAAFPFYAGFESGVWSNYWTVRTNGPGRIQQINRTNGFEVNRSLTMDSAGGAALNEATLTVDLSGQTSVIFRCWARDFADAVQPMPATFVYSTNADGIAASADGLTWYRLVDLTTPGTQSAYTNFVVDLAAFAAEQSLPLTSTFQIRFQQYGDAAFPAAGRSFDHVSLTPAPPATSTVIRAQGFEGETGDTWAFKIVPSLGQIAVRNERKANGTRSLRLAGAPLNANVDPYAEFENVSIGSYNHVRLAVAFSAQGADSGDDLYLDVSYDNGATWNGAGSVKLVDGYSNGDVPFGGTNASNPTTVTNNPWEFEVPAGMAQIKVRLRFDEASAKNNTNDFYFVDDLRLYYLPTNQPPALDPIGDWTALVSNRLEFAVVATDIDSNEVALVASNLPAGATFAPLSGTAPVTNWFAFTPDETQADAVYPVVFHVSDVDGYNAQTATIQVLDKIVTFSTNRLFVDEESGAATLGISLSRAADATVPLAIGGLAALDGDYVLSSTSLTFAVDGPSEQTVEIAPIDDELSEGPENVRISVASNPESAAGDDGCEIFIRDDDSLTLATANLTSGGSAIYMDAGARILQALVADVVAIQEFSVTNAAGHRAFVDLNFGTNFHYCVEPTGNLPNGVISRWPILDWGEWVDPQVSDRDFVWATVDVPGGRPLHVVSVHLHASGGTASREIEARLLTNYVAQAGFHPMDLVALCGDLNTQNRSEAAFQILKTLLSDDRKPTDQYGDTDTNQPRDKPYDVVLPIPYLDARHLPVHFGGLTFAEGLAFDTRLWTEDTIPYPALVSDSGTLSMQHMGVEKVFALDRFVSILTQAGVHGAIGPADPEVGVGSNQTFVVAADPYYHVDGLATNGFAWTPPEATNELVWVWSNAQDNAWLDVSFAENLTPAHGIPEWWLAAHGITDHFAEAEEDDLDGDGFFTWQEYVMDTHPRDSESFLRLDSMECARDGDEVVVGYVLSWPASTGRVYDVEYLADLVGDAWLPLEGLTNLTPSSGQQAVTNVFHDGRLRMLRLLVRQP